MSEQNFQSVMRMPQIWGFAFLAIFGPSLSILIPRVMAIVLPIAALLAIVGLWSVQRRLPAMRRGPWIVAALVVALCAASSLWAPDAGFVLNSSARMAGAFVSGLLLFFAANELPASQRLKLCGLLVGGYLFALVLICFNEMTHSALLLPFLSEHEIAELPERSNRGMVVLSIMLWPVLYAAQTLASKRVDWRAALLLVPITFLASLMTDSQSASAAILLGAVFYLAAQFWSRGTSAFIAWGGGLFLLTLPCLILLLRQYDPFINFDWRAASVGARIEIWYAVSDQIMHSPIIGHGMEAARFVREWGMAHLYYPFDTILHPHNGVLQIWYEFGLIGAVLTAGVWVAVVRRISFLPSNESAIALATLVAIVLISTISHGLWQSWWLGAAGLSPSLIRMLRQA